MHRLIADAAQSVGSVAFWAAVLIAVTAVLAAGLFMLRRWFHQEPKTGETTWTLAELRRLRDSGELTIQQYEHLRSAMLARHAAPDGAAALNTTAEEVGAIGSEQAGRQE